MSHCVYEKCETCGEDVCALCDRFECKCDRDRKAFVKRMKAYAVGTKHVFNGTSIVGEVAVNVKLPGDICIQWATGQFSSYDLEFLEVNTHPHVPTGRNEVPIE